MRLATVGVCACLLFACGQRLVAERMSAASTSDGDLPVALPQIVHDHTGQPGSLEKMLRGTAAPTNASVAYPLFVHDQITRYRVSVERRTGWDDDIEVEKHTVEVACRVSSSGSVEAPQSVLWCESWRFVAEGELLFGQFVRRGDSFWFASDPLEDRLLPALVDTSEAVFTVPAEPYTFFDPLAVPVDTEHDHYTSISRLQNDMGHWCFKTTTELVDRQADTWITDVAKLELRFDVVGALVSFDQETNPVQYWERAHGTLIVDPDD